MNDRVARSSVPGPALGVSLAPAVLGRLWLRRDDSESMTKSEVPSGTLELVGLHSKAMKWGRVGGVYWTKRLSSWDNAPSGVVVSPVLSPTIAATRWLQTGKKLSGRAV